MVGEGFHTKTQKGATLVEYSLLVALLAIICIGAVSSLGVAIRDKGYYPLASALDTRNNHGGGPGGGGDDPGEGGETPQF